MHEITHLPGTGIDRVSRPQNTAKRVTGVSSKLALSCMKPALLPFVLIWFARGSMAGYAAPRRTEAECW